MAWLQPIVLTGPTTVYPKKYAHGFVVLCFVVVMQLFIMNSHEVFLHIHQGCFAGTGAIVRLPQCQWSKPDGYWKISQCITTTKHSKAKTVCIFLGIYCRTPVFWDTPHRPMITHISDSHKIPTPNKTKSKLKKKKKKKMPKIQILQFCKKLYKWHTFWSCLIRCINMKWIQP